MKRQYLDMIDRKNKFLNWLCVLRAKYRLFTIEQAAADCGVSVQTVILFEKGESQNGNLILYYLSNALWELEYSIGSCTEAAQVPMEEVLADRQMTMAQLTTIFM